MVLVIDPPPAVAVYNAADDLLAALLRYCWVHVGPPLILEIGLLPESSEKPQPTKIVPDAGEYDGVVRVVDVLADVRSTGLLLCVVAEYVGAAIYSGLQRRLGAGSKPPCSYAPRSQVLRVTPRRSTLYGAPRFTPALVWLASVKSLPP